jgi:hypothetical protein
MVWLCQQKSYFWGLFKFLVRMIKNLAGIAFLLAISFTAIGQNTEKKTTARPDIPGIFTLEIGLNRGLNAPDNFDLGLWGSRTVNLYYQYELRILKSKFSFVPGIGVSLERFKFRNGQMLDYMREDDIYSSPVQSFDTLVLYSWAEHLTPGLKKSQLITNYVDVPLELRFTLNPDDPARSLKISVGGRVGYLYDAFNKIKYKEGGEIKQLKDKQNFNLNRFRYGAFAKIGFGSFSLFGYYNLTPLFKDNKGIYHDGKMYNDLNTFTAGISLSSF